MGNFLGNTAGSTSVSVQKSASVQAGGYGYGHAWKHIYKIKLLAIITLNEAKLAKFNRILISHEVVAYFTKIIM